MKKLILGGIVLLSVIALIMGSNNLTEVNEEASEENFINATPKETYIKTNSIMVEFEIIEIKLNKEGQSFSVEIEKEDRKRERFSFPINDGWEIKEENGKEKFINEISKVLKEREERKQKPNPLNFSDFKGKKIKS